MKNKGLILLIIIILVLVAVFLVRIPYTATEIYIEKVPYTVQELYTESQPITVEECKTDISLNPIEYINRGINNLNQLLKGDVDALLETCKDVIKYRTVTKSRDIISIKTVKKERQVTKTATPYMMMTGQVKYRYEV